MIVKALLLGPLALVFLAFGLFMLVTAYYQTNPLVFIALFFSSNLIVLLSLACLVGLIWRIFWPNRPREDREC